MRVEKGRGGSERDSHAYTSMRMCLIWNPRHLRVGGRVERGQEKKAVGHMEQGSRALETRRGSLSIHELDSSLIHDTSTAFCSYFCIFFLPCLLFLPLLCFAHSFALCPTPLFFLLSPSSTLLGLHSSAYACVTACLVLC